MAVAAGTELYGRVEPYAYADADNNFDFELLCMALGAMFDELDDLALPDEDGRPGWVKLFDVDTAPVGALGWLAQLGGVRLKRNFANDPEGARQVIRLKSGFYRGSADALIQAVKDTLSDTKSVMLIERDGSAYHFRVIVNVNEVASGAATEQAVIAHKPAGLTYTLTVTGWNYAAVLTEPGDSTYAALVTNFDTYHDLAVGP
jgi:hypothetical protein